MIPSLEAEELYARVRSGRCRIVDPLGERPGGQSEFTVEELEGSRLTFWRVGDELILKMVPAR